jgi:hypothetical protein
MDQGGRPLLLDDATLTPDQLAALVLHAVLPVVAAMSTGGGGAKPSPVMDSYLRALVKASRRHRTSQPAEPEPDFFADENTISGSSTMGLMTTRDIADQLGCTVQNARYLLRRGRIPGGHQVGGMWLADRAALAAYRRGGTGGTAAEEQGSGPG